MRISRRSLFQAMGLGIASAAFGGHRLVRPSRAQAAHQLSADRSGSEVAWRWFEQLYDVVKAERVGPPEASRIYGIGAVASYEAVVSGSRGLQSLAGQLNGLGTLPSTSSDTYWPASANAALAATIRSLLPNMSQQSRDAIGNLEGGLSRQMMGSVPAGVLAPSAGYGRAVAQSILEWASNDGFAKNRTMAYAPAARVESWRPTPPAFNANPSEPGWGANRPMVMASGQEGAPSGRPQFSLDPASGFYSSALEVYRTGIGLTPEQKATADYWADGPGATGTPPGHWIAIVSQISRNERLPLATAAEAYARVGIAVHDAFICCWNVKFAEDLLRPVTYINDTIDPNWKPYIDTPSFPSYTSGHSTQSGAAAAVLTDMFGKKGFRDATHVEHGLVPAMTPRTFSSFAEAAEEAAISRLYGGIHYTFDNIDGLVSGLRLGQTILRRINFRKDA